MITHLLVNNYSCRIDMYKFEPERKENCYISLKYSSNTCKNSACEKN